MEDREDIRQALTRMDAISADAERFASSLTEETGIIRVVPNAWCAAECFEHLAVFNLLFLSSMESAAAKARSLRRFRRGRARPSLFGRMFAGFLEPPVRRAKLKTPPFTTPQRKTLGASYEHFVDSHAHLRRLLLDTADLDLSRTRFALPLMKMMQISLIDGFHVLGAHERRHLWPARQALGSISLRSQAGP